MDQVGDREIITRVLNAQLSSQIFQTIIVL